SPKYAIFSMAKNHDPESFRGLYDLFDAVIFTQSKSQETQFYTPQELQEIFPGSLVAPDFDTALSILNTQYLIPHTSELSKGTILVTGSFYFCGEVRERFYPKAEIIKHRSEFF
ncbi:MAG TPA: hypothetical protein VIT68_04550, partial [Candidatus Gracilibacteria bacterium]